VLLTLAAELGVAWAAAAVVGQAATTTQRRTGSEAFPRGNLRGSVGHPHPGSLEPTKARGEGGGGGRDTPGPRELGLRGAAHINALVAKETAHGQRGLFIT
jgi:hypothetical protein